MVLVKKNKNKIRIYSIKIIYKIFLCSLILLFCYIFLYKHNSDSKEIKNIEAIEKREKEKPEEFPFEQQKQKEIFEEQDISYYKNYIDDCYNLKIYKRKNIKNENPFFSISLATYNMEKYIESTLLSILNQSFQDFEIIVINDFSLDGTLRVLEKFKTNNKIKIINHYKNLGSYASRVDGVRNSKGKFSITMDPDDMILNPDLLNNLYNYNIKYNLDIIEFKFLKYFESEKNFSQLYDNGFHNFKKNIIYQPELSNIFFYSANSKIYSSVQCRVVWNKLFRKEVLLKAYDYIGEEYYNKFIITAEDTLVSLISLQFANNYTCVNYTGYMYNIREQSITHGDKNISVSILFHYNYLLYLKKLYAFIKDYKKDKNFLFYELKATNDHLTMLYSFDNSKKDEINQLYEEILEDNDASNEFKEYINHFVIK